MYNDSKNNFYSHADFLTRRKKLRWTRALVLLFFILEYVFLFCGKLSSLITVPSMFGAFIIAAVLHYMWLANFHKMTSGSRLDFWGESIKMGVVVGVVVYLTFIAAGYLTHHATTY